LKKFIYVLIIAAEILFTCGGQKSEWYVVFHTEGNTIHKCPRDKYNEYRELIEGKEIEKTKYIYRNYIVNESIYYTENKDFFENML
jgi:hypothetical protein